MILHRCQSQQSVWYSTPCPPAAPPCGRQAEQGASQPPPHHRRLGSLPTSSSSSPRSLPAQRSIPSQLHLLCCLCLNGGLRAAHARGAGASSVAACGANVLVVVNWEGGACTQRSKLGWSARGQVLSSPASPAELRAAFSQAQHMHLQCCRALQGVWRVAHKHTDTPPTCADGGSCSANGGSSSGGGGRPARGGGSPAVAGGGGTWQGTLSDLADGHRH